MRGGGGGGGGLVWLGRGESQSQSQKQERFVARVWGFRESPSRNKLWGAWAAGATYYTKKSGDLTSGKIDPVFLQFPWVGAPPNESALLVVLAAGRQFLSGLDASQSLPSARRRAAPLQPL